MVTAGWGPGKAACIDAHAAHMRRQDEETALADAAHPWPHAGSVSPSETVRVGTGTRI